MLLNEARATALLAERGVDAVVATSPENIGYCADGDFASVRSKRGMLAFAIVTPNPVEVALVLPAHEVDPWAEKPGAVGSVTVYGQIFRLRGGQTLLPEEERIQDLTMSNPTHDTAIDALVAALTDRSLEGAVIGLEETTISPAVWEAVVRALPRASLKPAGQLLQEIRMVKTDEEIARLRKSATITAAAIAATFESVREGVTEAELATAFRSAVASRGGVATSWLISAGRRTGRTHTRQSKYAVQPGDVIKVDAGCTFDLYWSDLARTKCLGEPDPRHERMYEVLCTAVREATAEVRPGVRASHIFSTAVASVRGGGIQGYERHMVGHGVGITPYDAPMIKAQAASNIFGIANVDPLLEPGMVINVETPYYELGEVGLIVEDTVVVTGSGSELLAPMDYGFRLEPA